MIQEKSAAALPLPPGPRLPAMLQTLSLIERPFPFLLDCARRFGDPFTLRMVGRGACVVFSHPEAVREIISDEARFPSRAPRTALRSILGENSPLILTGDRHRRQRRLLAPLLSGQHLAAHGAVVREVVEETSARWPLGRPFPVMPWLEEIAIEVILRAVFGLRGGALLEFRRMIAMLRDVLQSKLGTLLVLNVLRWDLGSWSPKHRLDQALRLRDDLVAREIERRRREPLDGRADMLSLMLKVRDPEGSPLGDVEIRHVLFGMISAGMETPKAALAWTLYWILASDSARARLEGEIASAGEDGPGVDPAQLPYLDALCKEALRITPVDMLRMRIVGQPCEVRGQRLLPGMCVASSPFLTHRRPEVFPDPDRFWPERFLTRSFPLHEYYPFGFGERGCFAWAFAEQEIRIVIATLFQRFRLELNEPRPVRGVRRGALVLPQGEQGGIRVIASQRGRAARSATRAWGSAGESFA